MLLRDVAAVKRLKQEDGPNLVTQGSTELVHALLAADLVDQISIFTIPVVLGGGKKLFADGSAPHSYKLTQLARLAQRAHDRALRARRRDQDRRHRARTRPANVRSRARTE